jgi:methionyl aminopeptidase
MIHEAGNATIFALDKNKPIRSVYARKVLPALKQFEGLPFTTRNLTKQFPKPVVSVALRDMVHAGILHSYPPLLEVARGTVSQHEHSVIVRDKPVVFTRTTEDY